MEYYKNCSLCPRNCRIDRTVNKGFCKVNDKLLVARASLHMWEEPCISGKNGSGTVFFGGCSLGCRFCQNVSIRDGLVGKEISETRLAQIFIELQEKGANNINLVTPTHYIPSIKDAIVIAKDDGLTIPIVYNTSGYEKVESLKLLDGLVDVYLPDFKYWDTETAKSYSNAPNYIEFVKPAINEMFRQVGIPKFYKNGIMKKGIIVRHLLLPGYLEYSKKIIKYLYDTYKNDIYISIMNQHTPMPNVMEHNLLSKKVSNQDYEALIDFASDIGVENGFIQEGETAKESFIPPFDSTGV